jgi:HSP20 family molecular chaperone IbpA
MSTSFFLMIALVVAVVTSANAWCRFPHAGASGSHAPSSVRHRYSSDWPLEMALSRSFITPSEVFRIFDDDVFFHPRSIENHHMASKSSNLFQLMPMDVIETSTGYEMVLDLPGVDKNDIDISIKGDEMTISANRFAAIPEIAQAQSQQEATPQLNGDLTIENASTSAKEDIQAVPTTKKDYVRRERRTGSVTRSFSLPDDVDSSNVRAESKDGVLRILIGKKAEKVPQERKINIF